MIFSLIRVWVVCTNGNPYTWHASRSAAFAERKRLAALHSHARWTVELRDAEVRLAERKVK